MKGAIQIIALLGVALVNAMSADFEVACDTKACHFHGSGYGHGVGMCQWGARGMALDGTSYRDILAHYYPGAEIRKLY